MAKLQHVNNAKAIIALLILAIAFVIFFKFWTNQDAFSSDPNALRNYVVFAIVGGGLLIGLLYLTSNSKHSVSAKSSKSIKSSKSKKKKK